MSRTKKLAAISLLCAGTVMALLLTAVIATHLMANQETVKSFIVTHCKKMVGGTFDYDRLQVDFFPMPHVNVRNVRLHRPGVFEADARSLSVYPRILPILKGKVSIRSVILNVPGMTIWVDKKADRLPHKSQDKKAETIGSDIQNAILGFFGGLTAIEPQTELRIKSGSINLDFTDTPDLRITGIYLFVEKDERELSLDLKCRSDISGAITARTIVDETAMQAKGRMTANGFNLKHLLSRVGLPGDITAKDTRAKIETTFSIDGPESLHGRFNLRFPSVTVMRKGYPLALDAVALSGTAEYVNHRFSIDFDRIHSERPALDLSASAALIPTNGDQSGVIELRAAAQHLDVATASNVTRAIAGDLDDIQTAFAVARQGHLTDANYFVGCSRKGQEFYVDKMKASGHLTKGLVTIPGIWADLENMEGDVVYEDSHVAFKNVSGHFKGATFKKMDAAIDWQGQSTLSIASPSVQVEMDELFTWLTSFEGLAEVKNYIASVNGRGILSTLAINGPLTKPEHWNFEVTGTPETVRLTSSLVPFEITFSNGEITYRPGEDRSTGVKVNFLDGSFISSYHAKGIINPESATWHIHGSMGQETLDWLTTVLPIPEHLQMKPPVELIHVNLVKKDHETFSFTGGLKTAGGVDLYADITSASGKWHIQELQFCDGYSDATISAHQADSSFEITFSGNVEKETADRLLRDNRTLSGHLEGEFRALIDTRLPMNSSFSGTLQGNGLNIHTPSAGLVVMDHFSVDGTGGNILIDPLAIDWCDHHLLAQGRLDRNQKDLIFDMDLQTDRLDKILIEELQNIKNPEADPEKKEKTSGVTIGGNIRLKATEFIYEDFTWSPLQADIQIDEDRTQIEVLQAGLCGISTTGMFAFSPHGVDMRITPMAKGASLQESVHCLWNQQLKADAAFDLAGEISLLPTQTLSPEFMYGNLEFLSKNGKIKYSNLLMDVISILNITEVFSGGRSDLAESGYGYTQALVKAEIGGGNIHFHEILLDGNSLKITGQGTYDLKDREVDIMLLAAPLKTVDRIVNHLPIINYITGGTLISVPLRIEGKINDPSVVPMPPGAVGKGLLGIMERTLKAPFKLVESAAKGAFLKKGTNQRDLHNQREKP